jgi:TctA family transporter
MDLINNLSIGFAAAFTLQNLAYAFVGCLLGTLIGVLPGIGPVATIAMLLPATYALPPLAALIMLAGIYYGAQYGGSTTAILVNLPGEASSVVTCLDGYQMARRGRAGAQVEPSLRRRLAIGVAQHRRTRAGGEVAGDVGGKRGLADPAFRIHDCDDWHVARSGWRRWRLGR